MSEWGSMMTPSCRRSVSSSSFESLLHKAQKSAFHRRRLCKLDKKPLIIIKLSQGSRRDRHNLRASA